MVQQGLKGKNFHPIDLTSVYAYSDPSLSRDRELWRGFLGCVLPVIFPKHADNIEGFIIESLTENIEDLFLEKEETTNQTARAMRIISTHIAESIGVPKELALASFCDSECISQTSTKLYKFHHIPVKKHVQETKEENMIGIWISRFHQICQERNFLFCVELWKEWLD